jgi:hypothetical protein
MKGYKVFEPDWTCRGFQYAVGEVFEEDVTPSCCNRGFHFCKELKDCFNYYKFNPENKVAEIEALGDIDTQDDDSKCCTNKIKIVREISWEEVLKMVNMGKANTGFCNSGDCNSGNRNSGDHNSGNRNSGDYNSGDCNSGNKNSGDCNSGNRNSGDHNSSNRNSGDCNSGSKNSGDCNSGDCNSGDCNSGNRNSGDCNSGNKNSGDYNSGNRNSGDYNSGDCNSGNKNSGDYNSGNRNSGDWNKTSFSSGCFNTKEAKILMFNKPSDWTFRDWWNSEARRLLNKIQKNVLEWIWSDDMTDEEKEQHPEYKTTGGYLKELDESECGQIWWNSLSNREKDVIKALPNFDANIFKEITGIDVYET